jgi:protease I
VKVVVATATDAENVINADGTVTMCGVPSTMNSMEPINPIVTGPEPSPCTFIAAVNQIQSPAGIGVPLKLEVIEELPVLCARAPPAVARRPIPAPTAGEAVKKFRRVNDVIYSTFRRFRVLHGIPEANRPVPHPTGDGIIAYCGSRVRGNGRIPGLGLSDSNFFIPSPLYALHRFREEGWETAIAAPARRRLNLMMRDFEPGCAGVRPTEEVDIRDLPRRTSAGCGRVDGRQTVTCYEHFRAEVEQAGAIFVEEQAVRDGRLVTAQTWQSHPSSYREIFGQLSDKVAAAGS